MLMCQRVSRPREGPFCIASYQAIGRGSRARISPGTASSSAGGIRVVLPAPGGASRTRLEVRAREDRMSGRILSTGRRGR
jgi:hypothetical protein